MAEPTTKSVEQLVIEAVSLRSQIWQLEEKECELRIRIIKFKRELAEEESKVYGKASPAELVVEGVVLKNRKDELEAMCKDLLEEMTAMESRLLGLRS